MKTLRHALVLLFSLGCLATAYAQTEPVFEGLRFSSFTVELAASDPAVHGASKFIFKCNTNEVGARREYNFNKYWEWDWENPDHFTEKDLDVSIVGTNYFAVSSISGAIGDFIREDWTAMSNGLPLSSWSVPTPFDAPLALQLAKGNLTNLCWTNVAAEIALVIAGDPAFTNDVVVSFNIAAIDKDTGEAIPDADITVGGASVTNGVAWQSYKEHTTNDVTPVITGHANWTADLSAGIYRLTLEGSGFLGIRGT